MHKKRDHWKTLFLKLKQVKTFQIKPLCTTYYVCVFSRSRSEVRLLLVLRWNDCQVWSEIRNFLFWIFSTYRSSWQCSAKSSNSSSDQVRRSSRFEKDTFLPWKIPFLAKFFNSIRWNGTNGTMNQYSWNYKHWFHFMLRTKLKGWFYVLIFSMNPSWNYYLSEWSHLLISVSYVTTFQF